MGQQVEMCFTAPLMNFKVNFMDVKLGWGSCLELMISFQGIIFGRPVDLFWVTKQQKWFAITQGGYGNIDKVDVFGPQRIKKIDRASRI